MSNSFTVTPLSDEFVKTIRERRVDVFGNPVLERADAEPHQCRSCLRLTEPYEPYLALAHRPFDAAQPFAEVGPVYIHERECERYTEVHEYPPEFPHDAVVLRAYGTNDEIVDARFVGRRPVGEVVAEMFEDRRIAYLHARNSGYGCYMFRIDRHASLS